MYLLFIKQSEINQSYRHMEVMAGGLAASAACVFTNPMEVVKNRSNYLTSRHVEQIPGSVSQVI